MKRGISSIAIGISVFAIVIAVCIIIFIVNINNNQKNNTVINNKSNNIENILVKKGENSVDKIKYDNVELKIGDYVDYIPNNTTSVKYTKKHIRPGTDPYKTQTNLKWKVIGIHDGKLLLISEKPTVDTVYLEGAEGYLNGVEKLNELCKELYSSDKGIARSINLDDVNQILQYTGAKNGYFVETDIKYSYKNVKLEQPKKIGEIEEEIRNKAIKKKYT